MIIFAINYNEKFASYSQLTSIAKKVTGTPGLSLRDEARRGGDKVLPRLANRLISSCLK